MILSRKLIYLSVLLLFLVYGSLTLSDFGELRNFLNAQYMKFKEFLLLLESVSAEKKERISERAIRELLARYGLEVKEIVYQDGAYRIEVRRVPASLLVDILKYLQDRGRVEEFVAVDNTGRGLFDLTITVRPF
ncbi:MAG: hypothetical protein GXN96_06085 [Aquificae bacterium]|nr:hypothetical protein [Aquificota bacterium]